jgi:hypothetical protein
LDFRERQHPADFLNKWLAVIPAGQQAALYAELTALLTPPETHVRVEPFTSETTGRRIVLVKLGAYTFDLSPEEAIRLGHDFMKAATP